jgi:hypothetical protein
MDLAVAVTHDHYGVKAEPLSALYDLRDPVKVHELVFKLPLA